MDRLTNAQLREAITQTAQSISDMDHNRCSTMNVLREHLKNLCEEEAKRAAQSAGEKP